jgi:hypothetical protein
VGAAITVGGEKWYLSTWRKPEEAARVTRVGLGNVQGLWTLPCRVVLLVLTRGLQGWNDAYLLVDHRMLVEQPISRFGLLQVLLLVSLVLYFL